MTTKPCGHTAYSVFDCPGCETKPEALSDEDPCLGACSSCSRDCVAREYDVAPCLGEVESLRAENARLAQELELARITIDMQRTTLEQTPQALLDTQETCRKQAERITALELQPDPRGKTALAQAETIARLRAAIQEALDHIHSYRLPVYVAVDMLREALKETP